MIIAGTQELEAFQHTATSHSFPSPSKILPGQWFWTRDLTPVPSVRLASADRKKAARVKWGEAKGRVMLCISTLIGKESRLTGSERPGSFGCLLLICLLDLHEQ